MTNVGQPERATQQRVIDLFRDELGYRYLGDWTDRDGNSNIEEGLLTAYLSQSGYTSAQIGVALHRLRTEADNHNRGLYGLNEAESLTQRKRWVAHLRRSAGQCHVVAARRRQQRCGPVLSVCREQAAVAMHARREPLESGAVARQFTDDRSVIAGGCG